MPDKKPSFLARLYRFAFLALIIGGPVLTLPHTMPVFLFVAYLDAAIGLFFAALVALCYVIHSSAPEKFREANFGEVGAKITGATRLQRFGYHVNRLAHFAGVALLVATAHPVFGGISLLGYVSVSALLRLVKKVESGSK